ncbi:protein ROOT PRIMORDIUM DEFECTIVE 1 isoform X2 [Durio zibethinus]|uniref:Protein ROOT PRIMORDIUM DEFECTIVE 1 isoform X2 n=1 Tax=Durio zibethinus TaxID=66656 RepID=A0A6P6ABQ9_DURZI|nr:protein ROOT PRIMORDIUM DEFECTIVE 1 isoform X2 [Durio zibethinus]
MAFCTRVPHRLHLARTFVDARIKWVRDPYLDIAVEREKNLKEILSLKNQIVSSPSNSLPLSSLSPLKTHFNLPTSTSKLFQKYASVFSQFQPSPSLPLHVRLTPQAMTLHKEELAIHNSPSHRDDAVKRLAKLLMLTKAELISWRKELAASEMEKRASFSDDVELEKGLPLRFSMKLPNGFDLEKKVKNWVDAWQDLPYISPYENAFHLGPNSDQAEKWTVAVLHELLWLLVSKKTEGKNVLCLGEYLGFGNRFKKAMVHFPGIFYVSNKIRTQTVVLKEAYRKDFFMENHPLMGMRFRYIHLMNKADKFRKRAFRRKRKVIPSADNGEVTKEDDKSMEEIKGLNESSDSVFEDVSADETLKPQIIET